jgi:hypothetical protein
MRGLLTLLTKEPDFKRHRSAILVASAEPHAVTAVLTFVREEFPEIRFTYLVPESYSNLLSSSADITGLEEVKAAPIRSLGRLRRRKFDLVILMLTGTPNFRRLKIAALLLNPRRFIICNENTEFLIVDRARWNSLWAFAVHRTRKYYVGGPLFFPFGLLYLFGRTLWLVLRARRRRSHAP